jgi:hypothetical protein
MLPLATLEACAPGRRIDARLLTFRARAADQAHAAFTPGTAWPVIGSPARLVTREQPDPSLSMPPRFVLTTPQQGTPTRRLQAGRFLERLPGPHPTRSSAPSPCCSPRRSSTNAAQGGLAPSPEGRRPEGQLASIPSTAPPMNDVPYTTPPSAFVTHGCRTNARRGRWIVSKRGLQNRPSCPSRAAGPSRGRPARRLRSALPRARRAFSQTALCDSLRRVRA